MKFNQKAEVVQGGSNKFLKIEDGKSVNGIFRGDIHTFYNKWVNGKGQIAHADEPGAKPRFKLNFVTYENGAFVAKIFEFPQTVYNQLADIHEIYPLDKTKVKISRRGTGTDTVYMILPLLNEAPSPSVMANIEAVALNVLDDKSPPKPSRGPEVPMPDESDLPF